MLKTEEIDIGEKNMNTWYFKSILLLLQTIVLFGAI